MRRAITGDTIDKLNHLLSTTPGMIINDYWLVLRYICHKLPLKHLLFDSCNASRSLIPEDYVIIGQNNLIRLESHYHHVPGHTTMVSRVAIGSWEALELWLVQKPYQTLKLQIH